MKTHTALLACALTLSGCATPTPITWTRAWPGPADLQQDRLRCDYESTGSTQSTDYSYRSIFGQELDRALRRNELFGKCMRARGWVAQRGDAAPTTTSVTPQAMPTQASATPYNSNAIASPASPQATAAPQYTPPSKGAGKDLIQAEKFARQQSCSPNLTPWPAAMEPGSETYSATCNNGATMIIRCEYGNCRALR